MTKTIQDYIELVPISYEELKAAKKEYSLEIEDKYYDVFKVNNKDRLHRFKVNIGKETVGIFIYSVYKKGIRIECFEIIQTKRKKGNGYRIISEILNSGNEFSFYLKPLDENVENFWKSCGFIWDSEEDAYIYSRSKNENN